ncbi:hypothetical protein J2W37_002414 [Variovorax paradoxus]|uniref:Uncharacterized protein n=2 Tax=Variovorax TaxID=34072 RepID=A0AAE4BY76_VARPD|nr:hypothetical protein [Variovorax paradoxus]MDR6427593.1 hypothetical protein [Variovorax paradoxus]MDR6454755.1 hypothetical protein [Variovorax paradoxus]
MADVRNGSMSSTGTLSYVPTWWFAGESTKLRGMLGLAPCVFG